MKMMFKKPLKRKKVDFPHVVGAIDGRHVEIKAPLLNPADYFNRKQNIQLRLRLWLIRECYS